MTKIKDFLNQKLINFKKFIDEQFESLKLKGINIEDSKIDKMKNELIEFENNINHFVIQMDFLVNYEIDECIKVYLLKFDIDVSMIKEHIDYDKLSRYIEMFIEIIKDK